MHDYLDVDVLYYIFQLMVVKRPFELFICARVCHLWRDITYTDALWKRVVKKIKIVDPVSIGFKDQITKTLLESSKAVQIVLEARLLEYDETREWYFNTLSRRIQHAAPDELAPLSNVYREKHEQRNERMEKLREAFHGYLHFSVMGCCTLTKAKEIAERLASDRYMEKESLNDYDLFLTMLKNEGKQPLFA